MKTAIVAAFAAGSSIFAGSVFAQMMDDCAWKNVNSAFELRNSIKQALTKNKITQAEHDKMMKEWSDLKASNEAMLKKGSYDCAAGNKMTDKALSDLKTLLAPKAPARWEKSMAAIHTLSMEGAEVKRITAAEHKVIEDTITKTKTFIKDKAKDGISEAEEEQIDNLISDMTVRIATYMSDVPRKVAAAAASGPAAATPAGAMTSWVAASGSSVPANAVLAGTAKDGKPHTICRLKMTDGQVHPGKHWASNCYVAFGGKEIKEGSFEVLVQPAATNTSWVTAAGGAVPAKAVESGGTAGGKPLYICRAKLQQDGAVHPGKVYNSRCHVSYGGKELEEGAFDVLVLK